jgi:tetratricopeptide (TPR) repeat protein
MLQRVLAPYQDLQETHLVLAQAAYGLGEKQRAAREAQQALLIKPDSELAMLTLAQVTPDPVVVAGMLEAFLGKYPDAREVRTAYARLLVEQQRLQPAREQFRRLLAADPGNISHLYALGILSLQLDDTAVAENYFKQFLTAMAASPAEGQDPSKALMILSQIAEDRGDVPGALQWLDKIDATMPQAAYFNARLRRAQLVGRGDLDAGRKALSVIKTDEPAQQTQLLLADAQLLRDGGYDDTAYTVLASGLQRFPGNPELLYDLALAAERLNKMDVMEASLREVIAQAPDNRHAYNALGYSLAERNIRLPEALALIDKALKMAPNDPFVMDSMGWVQFRMGNLQQAEELLRRAYTLRNDPEIAVHLGEVLWVKGDQNDARKVWREARSKDPKNATLKSTLERLKPSL